MTDNNRRTLMTRSAENFTTREDGGELYLEGYFAVFNSNYEVADGMTESIDPHAFDNTVGDDIRCLINHDTTYVLGRTAAGTLELRIDSHGLWGRVRINRNDSAAMDLYARVQRGDVDGCSIGFEILSEETDFDSRETHWTITDIRLYEVSVVTFPAYEETNVAARQKDAAEARKRSLDAFKTRLKERLAHA